MRQTRLLNLCLIVAVVALGLAAVSCSQQAAPSPTTQPGAQSAPTVAPTQAPQQAKPTAAPAAQETFPEKGKTITIIVPVAAGGSMDVSSRIYAAELEKLLGVPVQVVNKPGAGQQVAMTELHSSKPDGYTIANASFPTVPLSYLDAEKKAVYARKDLQPVANYATLAGALVVPANSPYKTMADLINDAKARPGQVKVGTGGFMSAGHLPLTELEQNAGVKFALVHFDGGAPVATNLLGGHIDAGYSAAGVFTSHLRAGSLRFLAYFDTERSKFFPDTPTIKEAGYKADGALKYAFLVRAGTPQETVEILSSAIKKISEKPEVRDLLAKSGMETQYLTPTQLSSYWDGVDKTYPTLIEIARREQ